MSHLSARQILRLTAIFGWLSCSTGFTLQPTPTYSVSTNTGPFTETTASVMLRRNGQENYPHPPVTTCAFAVGDVDRLKMCQGPRVCAYENVAMWGPACCTTDSVGNVQTDCTAMLATTCVNFGGAEGYLVSSTETILDRSLLW